MESLRHELVQLFVLFLKSGTVLLVMAGFFLALYALRQEKKQIFPQNLRQSYYTDLLYYFSNVLIVAPFAYFLLQNYVVTPHHTYMLSNFFDRLPFWLQVVFAVYLVDLIFYCQHRLFHTKYFWPFHAVHHSTEHITWLSNLRGHPVDSIAHTVSIFAIPYLLGFSLDVVKLSGMISYFSAFFVHADLPWRYGPLRYVFVSPAHHRWHHSQTPYNKNFSGIFAFNDLLFNSYDLPEPEETAKVPFGLGDETYPKRFVGQFIRPLTDFVKTIRS